MENRAIEKYKKQCQIWSDALRRRLSEDKENKKLVSEIPEFQTCLANLNYNYLNSTQMDSCQFVADYLKDVFDFLNDTSNTLLFFNFENIPRTWQENMVPIFLKNFHIKKS